MSPSTNTDLTPALVARVGAICLALPEAHEQDAWTGVRWRIRQRTFAHLVHIDPSGRSIVGRAAGVREHADAITFRADGPELEALDHLGFPFYRPGWHPQVVGLVLTDDLDWAELAELLTDSYLLLAPQKLARTVTGPPA